jgi:predicted dienelactone hydrolase
MTACFRRLGALALSASLSLLATGGQAAGLKFVQIPADADGPPLKTLVWTPCAAAAQEIPNGPFTLRALRGCSTVGEKLPLIVISHGHGGDFAGHHDLAETLADAGYVVAAIDHPGDTYADMSHALELTEIAERPVDIRRLVDFMLGKAPDASQIDPARIGFFGFSMGGFTGLALAGAIPDFLNATLPCPDANLPVCGEVARQETPKAPFAHDARIRAFVIADPLNAFPTSDSLTEVKAPIQIWASEFSGGGILPGTVAALVDGLPRKPDLHVVPGAAHFAFLAPCSAEFAPRLPEICEDAGGFDRVAFHREMNTTVLSFFDEALGHVR